MFNRRLRLQCLIHIAAWYYLSGNMRGIAWYSIVRHIIMNLIHSVIYGRHISEGPWSRNFYLWDVAQLVTVRVCGHCSQSYLIQIGTQRLFKSKVLITKWMIFKLSFKDTLKMHFKEYRTFTYLRTVLHVRRWHWHGVTHHKLHRRT